MEQEISILRIEQPDAGEFEWIDGGIELLLRFEILIKQNGGCQTLYNELTGKKPQENKVLWTVNEDRLLAKQVGRGVKEPLILGRTKEAVNSRVTKLRKSGLIKEQKSARWSRDEIEHLRLCSKNKVRPAIDKNYLQIKRKCQSLSISTRGMNLYGLKNGK